MHCHRDAHWPNSVPAQFRNCLPPDRRHRLAVSHPATVWTNMILSPAAAGSGGKLHRADSLSSIQGMSTFANKNSHTQKELLLARQT